MDSKTVMEDSKDKIRSMVKEKYSGIAKGKASGCAPSGCGGSPSLVNIMDLGKALLRKPAQGALLRLIDDIEVAWLHRAPPLIENRRPA